MDNKILAVAVVGAAVVAGAVTMSIVNAPTMTADTGPGKEQCFGVAKAGENGCANAAHSCGGLAEIDKGGQDWMLVEAGTCVQMGGQLTAFDEAKPAETKSGS